jgi:hypothetical protein
VPVDDPGPFWEAVLTGLAPGTTYHYTIGDTGIDHTFSTAPTGDFTWVDMGDTGTTLCQSWMAGIQQLVADQHPAFVTHGGDISYANECGEPAVHRYYVEQQVWSTGAAFMPVWGNHEYGPPSANAPLGTPRDTLANYKGRSAIPNPQTVPNDGPNQISNPGCGAESSSGTNTCPGEDWGWFYAGHVLFISYPEPWPGAYPAWEQTVHGVMQQAQDDPGVDFVVTYGHRPAYTSSAQANTDLRTALTQLAGDFSPTAANPTGKYVLNVNHHVHAEEVFAPIGGLVNITDGGGGAGQFNFPSTLATGSIFHVTHPAVLKGTYDATQHSLRVDILCGPAFGSSTKDPCQPGASIFNQTFTRPGGPPPAPALTAGIDDGTTGPTPTQTVTYTATAANPVPGSVAHGVAMTVTLPPQYSITGLGGGAQNGNTVSWDLGDLGGGTQASRQVTATLDANDGDSLTATVALASPDIICTDASNSCTASDIDTVTAVTQWIANQSVEANLTGWTGVYSSRSQITRVTSDAHDGSASVQVTNKSTSRGAAGVNAKPRPVTTTALGKPYTASVWLRGQTAGQVLNVLLKEYRPNGTVAGSRSVRYQVPDTGWHQLTVTYTAAGGGDQLAMSIFCGNLAAKAWFHADQMSLTSPN